MGLGSFKGGDDDSEENTQKSRDAGKYRRITEEEFEDFLDSLWYNWHEANPDDDGFRKFSREKVYSIPPLNTRVDDAVTILVFSTIDVRTGKARDKGQDAIRSVIWDTNLQKPIGGRKKTLRIQTWKSNLRPKLEELVEETSSYLHSCSECGVGWMVKRDGPYGEFLGCVRYPKCENKEQIEDDGS